jgi:hypothetical protein
MPLCGTTFNESVDQGVGCVRRFCRNAPGFMRYGKLQLTHPTASSHSEGSCPHIPNSIV